MNWIIALIASVMFTASAYAASQTINGVTYNFEPTDVSCPQLVNTVEDCTRGNGDPVDRSDEGEGEGEGEGDGTSE